MTEGIGKAGSSLEDSVVFVVWILNAAALSLNLSSTTNWLSCLGMVKNTRSV